MSGKRPSAAVLLAACAAATLAGCAAPKKATLPVPAPAPEEMEFPAAASIMQGMEVDTEPGLWHLGDRVLLGISVTRRGETRTLYMETELVGGLVFDPSFSVTARPHGRPSLTLTSATCATRIRLYDETGKLTQEADGSVPNMILNCGPYEAAAEEVRVRGALAAGQKREDQPFHERSVIGFMVFLTFGQSSRSNNLLGDVVWRAVHKPSLIALLLNPSLFFGWPADDGPVRAPDWRLGASAVPAYRVPIEVFASGEQVTKGVLMLVPSTRPVGLCGGVVEADVQHPTEEGTHAHMRLLAAKRGDGDAVPVLEPMKSVGKK